MISSFINSLNRKQQEAVQQNLQPILVLAGPGTGKTRILVARIVWLMEKYSIPAEKILALTFTNKAASEMQSRLTNLCGDTGVDVNAGTIHSFALDVIRKYHVKMGLDKNFAVCDKEYQERVLQNLCMPIIRDNLENKVKGILLSFSQYQMKNKELPQFAKEKFKEYTQHLKKHQLIDFDQIIVFCRNLFRDNPDILSEYQYLYPAILVDEFQDTDPVQYEIIKLLALKKKNIFIVADDDQSIYSWRGANPENINQYIKDFDIQRINFLDINYRCGEEIVNSAHRIIVNTERVEPDKKLQSNTKIQDEIKVFLFTNESDEINFIKKKIKYWQDTGISYGEMAVIYPFHKIGQSLEHYLIMDKVPYQMAAGNSFLENPIVKRMILLLRIIRDVNDDIALEQLTESELGLSLSKMIQYRANQKDVSFRKSLYDFYKMDKGTIDFNSLLKIKNFVTQIASLINLKSFYSLNRLIEEIYLITNQSRYSQLSDKSKFLEKIPDDQKYKSMVFENKNNKNFYIHHSDKKIAFLASNLISLVLNTSVDVWDINNKENSPNIILFALQPIEELKSDIFIIPVYKYLNSKRQGSLSSLFRLMQSFIKSEDTEVIHNFVVLDLETTDKHTENCGIVEIAAVRVKEGEIVDEIQTLINPQKQISKGAQSVHHISENDVKNSPTIEEFWPKFKQFIGNDILIAHNGYNFDFAILDRFSRIIDNKKLENIKLDSLTMARNLYPEQSNSIDALVERFDLDAGTRHRALDDVKVLNTIVHILQQERAELLQNSSLDIYTDIVALANHIEKKYSVTEDRILYISGAGKLISPFGKILDRFCEKFKMDKFELVMEIKENLQNLDKNYSFYNKDDNLMIKIKLLANDFNDLPIDDAIVKFLSYLNLNANGSEQLEKINAISLLTFHAAKGLEFEKVILMGLEKNSLPGFHALREDPDDDRSVDKKIEEQRRLLYVGITRGKNEVILTAVKNRGGRENESSPFIKELKIPMVVA